MQEKGKRKSPLPSYPISQNRDFCRKSNKNVNQGFHFYCFIFLSHMYRTSLPPHTQEDRFNAQRPHSKRPRPVRRKKKSFFLFSLHFSPQYDIVKIYRHFLHILPT